MKIKEKDLHSSDQSPKRVTKNETIEKKKKKKKENFEVRIPRIIVRNLNFKVSQKFLITKTNNSSSGQRRSIKKSFNFTR